MHDVAKRAGVSTFTVSRVVNDSGFVREETRQRVLEAIAEMGYVPNAAARRLRSDRSHIIALLISDVSNPVWARVTLAIQEYLSQHGIGVILANTRSNLEEEKRQLDIAFSQGVGGIIVTPYNFQSNAVAEIRRRGIPCVVLGRRGDFGADVVRFDSYGTAYALTKLLLEQGYRRIALLTGPTDHSTSNDKYQAYATALGEAGLPLREEWVKWGPYRRYAGVQATEELLALDERPQALVSGSSALTLGALEALGEHQLQVPEDMGVVGSDGVFALYSFLTAAYTDCEELGKAAAEMLHERMEAHDGEPREVIMPFEKAKSSIET